MGELIQFPGGNSPPVKSAEGACRKCGRPILPGAMYAPGPEHVGACPAGTFTAARVEFYGPAWAPAKAVW